VRQSRCAITVVGHKNRELLAGSECVELLSLSGFLLLHGSWYNAAPVGVSMVLVDAASFCVSMNMIVRLQIMIVTSISFIITQRSMLLSVS
jgi:hypothetical protein